VLCNTSSGGPPFGDAIRVLLSPRVNRLGCGEHGERIFMNQHCGVLGVRPNLAKRFERVGLRPHVRQSSRAYWGWELSAGPRFGFRADLPCEPVPICAGVLRPDMRRVAPRCRCAWGSAECQGGSGLRSGIVAQGHHSTWIAGISGVVWQGCLRRGTSPPAFVTAYALDVGLRYLRSKKRASISVISVIAITGVALGVAALLAVTSITSGFQREFRDKVLGVNAHVLVLKYGLNFDEYRDVVARAAKMPEVAGAAPFIINEMMLAKGDRLSGVLVKGVDPELMLKVLDLPSQLIAGSLEGLRRPGAAPSVRPEDLDRPLPPKDTDDLDAYLTRLADKESV